MKNKTLKSYLNKRKLFYIFVNLCVIAAFSACTTASETIAFYVSVEGNDAAEGSLSEPFATIPKAVTAVRELRKAGNTKPATIYLRGGRHQLNETLILGIEDGLPKLTQPVSFEDFGAGELAVAQLAFTAYLDEKPVISGGMPVTA